MYDSSANAILNRLQEVTGAKNDSELATKLGVSKQAVSSARRKDAVPISWLSHAAEKYGKSMDWLKWGTVLAATGVGAVIGPASALAVGGIGAAIGAGGALIASGTLLAGVLPSFFKDFLSETDTEREKLAKFLTKMESLYSAKLVALEEKLEQTEAERRSLSDENRELWKRISVLQDELRMEADKKDRSR